MTQALRLTPCPDCDGGRVYDRDYGFTARTCETCDGMAEIEEDLERCVVCKLILNDGECPVCDAHLTETRGDPLKGPGWHGFTPSPVSRSRPSGDHPYREEKDAA